MKRRIAVIGAGASGLAAIKCCLDEGLEPMCFEQSDGLGGLWRFKEEPEDGRSSIYRSVIINSSKEMMCYSDFPIPDDFANFMHNSKILEYFHLYARHFDLLRYIRFKTTVRRVKMRPDFSRSGQWEVVTATSGGLEESAIFDGVMVCTGHHTYPHLPLQDFRGIETFQGEYFHSREYKGPEKFLGKRVIIIGVGNSGGDLAVELSRIADQVFLSTRRGCWVLNRILDDGLPYDMLLITRFASLLKKILPFNFLNWMEEQKLNKRFDHKLYGLQAKHRVSSQHPTVNDELPNRIISGTVVVKPNIKELRGSSVTFEDGSVEDKIDVVIFATGYNVSFPFLDSSVITVRHNQVSLYKHVFPPALEHPTLAFIGLVQAHGPLMVVAEMQARWVTRVFAGFGKLPQTKVMLKDIQRKKDELAKCFVSSQRHTFEEDFIYYMDELATQIGTRPSIPWLFLRDPRLALVVFLGPCTPYQYRLMGPGKWAGARNAIFTQWERVFKPLQTRMLQEKPRRSAGALLFKVTTAIVLCAMVTYYVHWQRPALLQKLVDTVGIHWQ
ncbi:flavin-containing monooxygenase 5-like [Erpetoichthys calabaricus]|uniref:Flavin-containing monooxygenase n=1 Tax=Erpetoichthys calabaricus TaxID=27687 RepID=A0A8C4TMP0_ERPCA|nr:flavin-containing monooxygenase 5-like [Erpetoichthys calabaricus]